MHAMNIFLIGYRCTGKTTVGKGLAASLGYSFVDTDELIVRKEGQKIDKIVARGGWGLFRGLEKQTLEEICKRDRQVVATGGGIILDLDNVGLMKRKGRIVWLKAGEQAIYTRMVADTASARNRPALTLKNLREEIVETLREREPLYRRAMDLEFDTEKAAPEAVLQCIVERIEGLI